VLHPRAAEIAMLHRMPLWVKSSFSDAPGTLVAPLEEVVPPTRRGVSGITGVSSLSYHVLKVSDPTTLAAREADVYRRLGDEGVTPYLMSHTADSIAFVTAAEARPEVEAIAAAVGLTAAPLEPCAMVSAIAVDTWDTPGLIFQLVETLHEAKLRLIQLKDSVGAVACLVPMDDAGRAVKALHDRFQLAG
jgi:aspartate kinase